MRRGQLLQAHAPWGDLAHDTLAGPGLPPIGWIGNCSDLVGRIGRKPLESRQLERQQPGFVSDFRPSNPRIPSSRNSYLDSCLACCASTN